MQIKCFLFILPGILITWHVLWFMVIHCPNTPPLDNLPPFARKKISLGRSSPRRRLCILWWIWSALVFSCFPPGCCAVLIVVQQNAKVPPNKNPTMSLFLISQSFRPYNVVFISGGSVEEGFCLRLFYINPTDNAKKQKNNLFHFKTSLNAFR